MWRISAARRWMARDPKIRFREVTAALNVAVLRGEIARIRKTSRGHLDAEIARLRDDARSYRLLAAPGTARTGARHGDEERLARSGVEEIHQSVHYALDLLRRSLDLFGRRSDVLPVPALDGGHVGVIRRRLVRGIVRRRGAVGCLLPLGRALALVPLAALVGRARRVVWAAFAPLGVFGHWVLLPRRS